MTRCSVRPVARALLAAIVVLAALTIGGPVPSSAQDGQPDPYLWLAAGDSYSAGEGVGDDSQRCSLSLFAYPRQTSRSYGDSDDAWSQLFGDTNVPPRTSDDANDIWDDDLDAGTVPAGRSGVPVRAGEVDIDGRDETHRITLGTFRDFWGGRSTEERVDIDQRWAACSGGRIEDLFHDEKDRPAQLSELDGQRADLITMSMGGNDLGFGDILTGCIGGGLTGLIQSLRRYFPGSECNQTLDELTRRADYLVAPDDDDTLELYPDSDEVDCQATDGDNASRRPAEGEDDPLVDSTYRCSLRHNGQIPGDGYDGRPGVGLVDVYTHVAREHLVAGTGHLVIVGYPRFFATRAETDKDGCSGFTDADIRLLNDAAEYLDRTLREAVDEANDLVDGEPISYLSILAAFDDNGLCGSGEDWLNGVNLDLEGGRDNWPSDSFHPTRAGHDGLTGLLTAELEGLCGFRSVLNGLDAEAECAAGSDPGASAVFAAASSSTVMVIDVSSSMNDPSPVGPAIPKISAAIQAAQDLISVVEIDADEGFDHTVGLVAFNEDADLVTRSTSDLDGAAADAGSLVADGDTDIGTGLSLGIDTILGSAEVRRIVLLSDGEITNGLSQDEVLAQVAPEAIRRGVPIDVIGFATPGSLDEAFLQELASRTGGNFSLAATADELRRAFIRARHDATGTVIVEIVGEADVNTGAPLSTFEVPLEARQLVVSLGYQADRQDLQPVLVDPFGAVIAEDQLQVVGQNPVTVALRDPLPGTWSVHISEPDELDRTVGELWSPPVDGASADAQTGDDDDGDGDEPANASPDDDRVPFILVVSTREGGAGALGPVTVSEDRSLPWLAAAVPMAALTLVVIGLGLLATANVRVRPDPVGGAVAASRWRWLVVGIVVSLALGTYLALSVLLGGLNG